MSGITSVFKLATLTFFVLLGAGGSLAEEPRQCVVNVEQVASRIREGSDETSARAVLSPKEIERLLAKIRSRSKGSVLVVDCTGAYGYATIQSAIDAAEDGDIVVVLPNTCAAMGCYYERIDFLGKAITVQSAQPTNPAVVATTIINGFNATGGGGHVVTFVSGEGPDSVLDGLMITGGNPGSGAYCQNSSPTLTNCIIRGNSARSGGGVCCDHASPELLNCTIEGNTADTASFAAVGGGVCCLRGSNPILTGCVIRDNSVDYYGGGLSCSGSSRPILTDCVIHNNTAYYTGGGLYCTDESTPVLTNCRIGGNEADYGGGVYTSDSTPTLINCVISKNIANTIGGACCCHRSDPTLANCTISQNRAYDQGGGLFCSYSSPTLTNCVLWSDLPHEIQLSSFSTPDLTYCIVQGGWQGEGNLDVDPLFAFTDDPRLVSGSPCIDAGTNTLPCGLPSHDADGNPRLLDGNGDLDAIVDIGAYEFNPDAPTIAVGPNVLEMNVPVNDAAELPQALLIRNAGGGTLRWTLTWDADWLQAEPVEGESCGEIDVVVLRIAPAAITPGLLSATLTVSDNAAPAHSRSVNVSVNLYVSRTLHVPDAYSTIQAAIDAAGVCGDEVVVADGVYTGSGNKDLDLLGKEITVRSASGDPALCIIDCEGDGCGFGFYHNETRATQVCGFTVSNGGGYCQGGGMYFATASSPTISRCWLIGNRANCAEAGGLGGGVCCAGSSSPTLVDCVISENYASYCAGGIYCESQSSPTFIDCVINENIADYGAGILTTDSSYLTLNNCIVSNNSGRYGGGLYCEETSRVSLTDCTVLGNHAKDGAGMYDTSASLTASGCTIVQNIATGYGAGVYCSGGSLSMRGCLIRGNESIKGGAGVYSNSAVLSLADCRIIANKAGQEVGGVFIISCVEARLDNCVVADNLANCVKAGIRCQSCSDAKITNCTLINSDRPYEGGCLYLYASDVSLTNSIVRSSSPQSIYLQGGAPPVVTYCNIVGGWEGEGNIDVDPRFAIAGDYRLAADSPCIDAGTNTPPGGLSNADIDGNVRCADGDGDSQAIVDIGAHEFHPGIPVFVVGPTNLKFVATVETPSADQELMIANAGSGGPALQWSLASDATWLHFDAVEGELQPGEVQTVTLSVDVSGLAPGTYAAALNVDAVPPPVHPRPIDVLLVVGNTLHVPDEYGTIQEAIDATAFPHDEVVVADGVYTGAGNWYVSLRGKEITVRSASGDPAKCIIDCEGDGPGFVFYEGETEESVVDGFTVRNGSASEGAGVHIRSSSPTLSHCCFMGNAAFYNGGGVYCFNASPVLIDCTVSGNTASNYGAGIHCYNTDLTLTHCVISDNTTDRQGGGIYARYSSVTLTNCVFSENSASYAGGGVYCYYDVDWTSRDCVFSRNTSRIGAAAYFYRGQSMLSNCVLNGNSASDKGGALYCDTSDAALSNCSITGNAAGLAGGALYCYSGEATLTNCILWGDQPEEIGGYSSLFSLSHCDIQGGWVGEGANNIDVDPLFIDTDGPDELPGTADDDLRLQPTSPCIGAGDPEYVADEGETDLDGRPRVMGCSIDIGAYEFLTSVPGSGDLDGNGTLDVDDIALFVQGLLNDSNLAACVADMNDDDRIDGRDIQLYTEMLLAP